MKCKALLNPKLATAPPTVVAPVPPLLIGNVPLVLLRGTVPVEIVPKVVILVLPAQVLNAVFSTFPRPTSLLLKVVQEGT